MLKVLVVADEALIRKGLALAVDWAALDCVVVGEAANGREALEAVKRYHPSLIFNGPENAGNGRTGDACRPAGAGESGVCDYSHRL